MRQNALRVVQRRTHGVAYRRLSDVHRLQPEVRFCGKSSNARGGTRRANTLAVAHSTKFTFIRRGGNNIGNDVSDDVSGDVDDDDGIDDRRDIDYVGNDSDDDGDNGRSWRQSETLSVPALRSQVHQTT